MNRRHSLAYRHNARTLSVSLPEHVRRTAYSDRFVGRAVSPPSDLSPALRTRFSAVRSALDSSRGLAHRIGDPTVERRESHEFEVLMGRGGSGNPVSAAVRLLHLLVPCNDDLVERAHVIAELDPVTAQEVELWPLVQLAANHLAGIKGQITRPTFRSALLDADRSHGPILDELLMRCHPLAVLAAVQTIPKHASPRRLRTTSELLHRVFDGYVADADIWTAGSDVWAGLYLDTTSLISLELDAQRAFQAAASISPELAQVTWNDVVRPLTWVNATMRRLELAGADIGEFLLLPTEPRPNQTLRPDAHLFSTGHLRRLMLLGCEILSDPVELWAWRNLWTRGCRPQACLPLPSELLPFDDESWRVLVPAEYSKTGLIVDYVLSPVADLLGWTPVSCPNFVRATDPSKGLVPTRVAEAACRRVRAAWSNRQRVDSSLPDLPDRLAYMTRKLMALWLTQRVPTPVLTRWLSHSTSATNAPYSRPTASQVLEIRHKQREQRP